MATQKQKQLETAQATMKSAELIGRAIGEALPILMAHAPLTPDRIPEALEALDKLYATFGDDLEGFLIRNVINGLVIGLNTSRYKPGSH